MRLFFPVKSLLDKLSGFRSDKKGVALVEFAMVLPVMMVMYLGGVAVTQGIMTDRKLTLLTRSLGDIISQDTSITADERDDIFNAARVVMFPYPADSTLLKMRVSSIRFPKNATNPKTCVDWSLGPSGSTWLRTKGTNVDSLIPGGMVQGDSWIIMAEVEYTYTPVVGQDITGVITMKDQLLFRPRQSAHIDSFNQSTPSACPT